MRIQRAYARRLITKRPGVKENYLKELEIQLDWLQFKERMGGIKRNLRNSTSQQIATQLNHIDQLKTRAMQKA